MGLGNLFHCQTILLKMMEADLGTMYSPTRPGVLEKGAIFSFGV